MNRLRMSMKSKADDRLLLTAWLSPAEREKTLRKEAGIDEDLLRAIERLARLVVVARIPASFDDDALERLAAHRAGLAMRERTSFDAEVTSTLHSVPGGEALRARWDALCDRMANLDQSSSAVDHFAQVTGRPIRVPDRTAEPDRVVRVWTLNRWAAAAVVATLALTATLGRVLEDPQARAAFRSLEARSASRTRSGIEVADRLAGWTARLESARNLRLGLWPTYDRPALERLEAELVASGDSTPAVLLLLGEARMMHGSFEGGLEAVRASAEAGNEEARQLLEDLR